MNNKKLYRCKYFPEVFNSKWDGKKCKKCQNLISFFHCNCFNTKPNISNYKKSKLKNFLKKTKGEKQMEECKHKWIYVTTIKKEYTSGSDGRNGSSSSLIEKAIFRCEKCSELKTISSDN